MGDRVKALLAGQELWLVPSARYLGDPSLVTVGKVGRKWAEVKDGKFDSVIGRINVETLFLDGDGYTSAGRCWLNRADWEAETSRQSAWEGLRRSIDRTYDAPPHVSHDSIKQIIALLAGPPATEAR